MELTPYQEWLEELDKTGLTIDQFTGWLCIRVLKRLDEIETLIKEAKVNE